MATANTVRELVSAEEPIPAAMSIDQYLSTMFHPDCDYVDGRIEERNVGEVEHSWVQKSLMSIFLAQEAGWGVELVQECRLQVAEERFRIPDSMVLRAGQKVHRIVREAPLICIEVMSPEDTWKRLRGVLTDYLEMGVPNIWAFDPEARTAHRFDAEGLHLVMEAELTVPGTQIRVNVAEVFSLVPKALFSLLP
jgi:Uma2 family endonuclease